MKVRCFKCKGKGFTRKIDWMAGVFTLGMSALMDASDRHKCKACAGLGYLEDD